MAKIHNLLGMSMERAYDKTQCSDIEPGDFLQVEDGIAMMDGAYPVMISGVSGVFHEYHDTDEGRALRATALARYEALEAAEAAEAGDAPALILTKPQAEAVYSAMCHLNNVGARIARLSLDLGARAISVEETPDGELLIVWLDAQHRVQTERHANQAAFAAAYGLEA